LKQLGERLGLDVSTVSRALRNDPRVRPDTAEAVRRLAQELDYRPNSAARALRGGLTHRVAVLLSPPQQRFASPIFLELLATLDQKLRETGRTLAVFAASTREEEPEIVRSIVEDRLADGLVLGRTRTGDERVRYLLDRAFPFVTLGRTDWPERHPWVEIDYRRAGQLGMEMLAGAEPRRLHVLAAPEGLRFADDYVTGALAAAEGLGLPMPRIHRGELTEAVGEALAAPILAEGGRLALACIQDAFAFGAFRAAAVLGLRFGEDATICGGQNFPGSEHTAPPLTTFSTEDHTVAELLSETMLARLDGEGGPPFDFRIVLPTPILRMSHINARPS
jgi:LacI family transcriptional regulator